MKKGIHPENYRTVLFYDSNAKQGFLIRSCAKTNNTMKWEDGNEYGFMTAPLVLLAQLSQKERGHDGSTW